MHKGNASQSLQSLNLSLQELNISLQSLNINLPSLNIHVYKKAHIQTEQKLLKSTVNFFLFPQSEPRSCYSIILKPGFNSSQFYCSHSPDRHFLCTRVFIGLFGLKQDEMIHRMKWSCSEILCSTRSESGFLFVHTI